jgi:hypothetical protein
LIPYKKRKKKKKITLDMNLSPRKNRLIPKVDMIFAFSFEHIFKGLKDVFEPWDAL